LPDARRPSRHRQAADPEKISRRLACSRFLQGRPPRHRGGPGARRTCAQDRAARPALHRGADGARALEPDPHAALEGRARLPAARQLQVAAAARADPARRRRRALARALRARSGQPLAARNGHGTVYRMKILIVGAGPAGLYLAYLVRRKLPGWQVRVIEQNARDSTFGFGVVFSERALEFLRADDPETYERITPE